MPALLLLLMLPAAAQELTTSVLDAGGSLTGGGEVEMTGSFGAFGEVTGGDDIMARAGFPGQIYDPVRLAVTPGEAIIPENSSVQFTAAAVCDDDTLLAAGDITWQTDSPLFSVSPAGEVTTGLLPGSFSAVLTATAGGVSGTAVLQARDADPDNFGAYAGDGLPDSWQTLHFGSENPDAAPSADPDADGQNNQTEYLAGTDPGDPQSLLEVAFTATPAPDTKVVTFAPWLPGRTYTLEWSASLEAPWIALPEPAVASPVPGWGQISDPAPEEARKMYRVRITLP